jgi:hypothetical protein
VNGYFLVVAPKEQGASCNGQAKQKNRGTLQNIHERDLAKKLPDIQAVSQRPLPMGKIKTWPNFDKTHVASPGKNASLAP